MSTPQRVGSHAWPSPNSSLGRGVLQLAVLALLVGLIASTAAFRPASLSAHPYAQTTPEEELTLRLAALGISVREVDLAASPARIAYDQAIGEAREALPLNWVMILRTALEVVPDLENLRLEMYYLGDPSLVITTDADSVLMEDLAEAVAGLKIEDVRPPEEAIRQGMALLGIPHALVSRTADTTTIHFVVPPDLSAEAILGLWVEALSLAAEESPTTPRLVLDLVLSDGTGRTVEALTNTVQALLDGRLDPLEFAATLVISGGEPARAALPFPTGLAVSGVYFLLSAALVGAWVTVRIRTSLTKSQQAIIFAAACGVAMMGCLILYLSLRVPPVTG